MLPKITTLNGFEVRLGNAAKETRCSSIRTDPSHQALPPKTNYMPFPDDIENKNVPIYQINTDHN